MNQRTEYLLQVFESIGSPLMISILQAPGRMGDETQNDALRLAELLAKTTQASIEMSQAMDLAAQPDQGDALRVALAALASNMVGSYYKNSGRAPGDNDLRKMTAAMQTVLTFSENFNPGPEAAGRMENLPARGQQTDEAQVSLQYIHAFIPVVNAITAFSFGQAEQKFVMDVAGKILARAAALRDALFPGLSPADGSRVELALVAALTDIYAGCHNAETARLMALSEQQRTAGGPGPETVWNTFNLRVDLLEALATSLVPESGQAKSGARSSGGPKTPPPPLPVQETQAPPQQPPSQAVPPAPPATPLQTANPLSMFAKSPSSAAPPPQAPAAPPPTAPPAQNGSQSGSGPMSFFKAPPKKSDE